MPKKDGTFTRDEQRRIRLAVLHLEEFHAGYRLHCALQRKGPEYRAAFRFTEKALIAISLGQFGKAREQEGLLPILELVGFRSLARRIRECLDLELGTTTLAVVLQDFRTVAIAHQHFRVSRYRVLAQHLETTLAGDNEADYLETWARLKKLIAACYVAFKLQFPELVAEARSVAAELVERRAQQEQPKPRAQR